jgi:hypothetical protein
MNSRSVGAQLFHTEGRKDGRTDIVKPIHFEFLDNGLKFHVPPTLRTYVFCTDPRINTDYFNAQH